MTGSDIVSFSGTLSGLIEIFALTVTGSGVLTATAGLDVATPLLSRSARYFSWSMVLVGLPMGLTSITVKLELDTAGWVSSAVIKYKMALAMLRCSFFIAYINRVEVVNTAADSQ